MKKLLPVVCVFLLLGADKKDDAKKDMAQMEGKWSMVSGERDGQPLPDDIVSSARRVVKAGETTVTIGGELFLKAKFTLDLSKKPKAIDYTVTGGQNEGKTQLGIYELDGDTVKFCFAAPGEERPTEFRTKTGSGQTLSVWKREKKKDK
jgi:uncharacterized protein (TIGR03067 family)